MSLGARDEECKKEITFRLGQPCLPRWCIEVSGGIVIYPALWPNQKCGISDRCHHHQ